MNTAHKKRIGDELRAVGVTKMGMKRFSVRYLPNIIHENEHIGGVVYGRYRPKQGGPALNEGLLVATNTRVIFLDHKPGYTDIDEITYEIVSGINKTTAVFSSVTLHTRLGDYTVRFANPRCAETFVHYVERRRLENTQSI